MNLLSLPCEKLLVLSNWGCQKKKKVSRYDKLHSFSKSPLVISLKLPYTCKVYSDSQKTATKSVIPPRLKAGINNFAFPRMCVKPCMF